MAEPLKAIAILSAPMWMGWLFVKIAVFIKGRKEGRHGNS